MEVKRFLFILVLGLLVLPVGLSQNETGNYSDSTEVNLEIINGTVEVDGDTPIEVGIENKDVNHNLSLNVYNSDDKKYNIGLGSSGDLSMITSRVIDSRVSVGSNDLFSSTFVLSSYRNGSFEGSVDFDVSWRSCSDDDYTFAENGSWDSGAVIKVGPERINQIVDSSHDVEVRDDHSFRVKENISSDELVIDYIGTVCEEDVESSGFPVLVSVGNLSVGELPLEAEMVSRYNLEKVDFCQEFEGETGVLQELCVSGYMPYGLTFSFENMVEDVEVPGDVEDINVTADETRYSYGDVKALQDALVGSKATESLLEDIENEWLDQQAFNQKRLKEIQEKQMPEAKWSGRIQGLLGGVVLGMGALVVFIYIHRKKKSKDTEKKLEEGVEIE